ncbi:MAG: single-stranded DNA-binding protein [Chloroflexi bacterium]|nr:MAG: single-stranded DNA-binding protein [Chloroflexota bacterium]RLC86083.1 MAG: single-stranded DNA-binding protein [Chloroflexota bacterium]
MIVDQEVNMYHKIVLVGYLGRDPEMRYTPSGQPVTHFSVATNRRWTDQEGQQHDETTWWRVTAWGRQAEVCNQYLQKGRLVLVEGRIRPDPATGGPRLWTGNDGVVRASFEVTAQAVKFLGRAGEAPPAEVAGAPEEAVIEGEEEAIPF